MEYQALYDLSAADFPRLPGETDDAPRLQRAIDACPEGVLLIPKGEYLVASPLVIRNFCSLLMHKSARLVAAAEMDFVLSWFGDAELLNHKTRRADGSLFDDMNLFISGGDVDGRGLAGCLHLETFHHFTLRDITLHNGRKYGLRAGEKRAGYELIATNVYCKCNISGLAGNVAFSMLDGDSHFTDCVVVDYTKGFELLNGGSNRLTRCHVWGGPVPPKAPGELPEMLVDSVCYDLRGWESILRDCYADTGAIGFDVYTDCRMLGCSYFSNPMFHLDDITIIRHHAGNLLVSGCRFAKNAERVTVYEGGSAPARWRDNSYEAGLTHPWEDVPDATPLDM